MQKFVLVVNLSGENNARLAKQYDKGLKDLFIGTNLR